MKQYFWDYSPRTFFPGNACERKLSSVECGWFIQSEPCSGKKKHSKLFSLIMGNLLLKFSTIFPHEIFNIVYKQKIYFVIIIFTYLEWNSFSLGSKNLMNGLICCCPVDNCYKITQIAMSHIGLHSSLHFIFLFSPLT